MTVPTPDQFEAFYKAVHGKPDDPTFGAFPWQKRLAKRVHEGDWPRAIALPTAAGKTACIDIAVFALACRSRLAARRIFFIIDRRIVVDQAWIHAKKLQEVLRGAQDGILKLVADSLRELAQDERPLDVYALRGGMYRESAWARSPLQPTVVASTVDQVGSRLLFRGYGVSDSMKPIHAGLIGNDALILLDEAHCAKPFDQTMQAIEKYRTWGQATSQPFRFVSITATPAGNVPTERDEEDDRKHPVLGKRIGASKPARLVIAKNAKGAKTRSELVKELEKHAKQLAQEFACVGIIVNRVATARELARKLGDEAVLLTGRMRPLDRDRLFEEKLKPLLSNGEGAPPKYVVGTQCLECGADFDFHAMVSECASLDALRQRFGRLNRVANRSSTKAVVVIRGDQIDDTADDPIYGESLANTWKWLNAKATNDVFDFGVSAVRTAIGDMEISSLNAPTADAPVLFPAHLDCWVQTHPIPQPDPDPALFLHGPKTPGQPDVQVVFRSDLGDRLETWAEIISLCPPSSSEAVAVPIGVFKKWIAGEKVRDETSDLEGEAFTPNGDETATALRSALRWRGPENSANISDLNQVTPNDMYIVRIPNTSEEIELDAIRQLADLPDPVPDHAEEAFQHSRDKAVLRLPRLQLDENDDDFEQQLSAAVRSRIAADFPKWSDRVVEHLTTEAKRTADRYPDPLQGFVVTGKYRLRQFDPTFLEDGEPTESFRGGAVSLDDHSRGVARHAREFAECCGLDAKLYFQAGLWHDLGKLDPRFQAMLQQSSPRTAVGIPLAKSTRCPRTKQERDQAREIHRYPSGARHELLSAALVSSKSDDDLLLHLIATHHGSGRPFADPVTENDAIKTPFETSLFAETFNIDTSAQEIAEWNGELPGRFWRVVRKYGWWGAAYREAILRLADHAQSRAEQNDQVTTSTELNVSAFGTVDRPRRPYSLGLPGLDGSNPLAFLAAIGILVECDRISRMSDHPDCLAPPVKLSWGDGISPHIPVLHLGGTPTTPPDFAEILVARMAKSVSIHPAAWVVEMLTDKNHSLSELIRHRCVSPQQDDRQYLDWIAALACETAPDASSQLQTVRKDYLIGNLTAIMQRTTAQHVFRSLFQTWDYGDPLDNQSLHWEPSEDRRHAYQWHMPSGDPTRKKRGGMLGANRIALEAWPLFPTFSQGDQVATRGFKGNRAFNTFFTWPLWTHPINIDVVASVLALEMLQSERPNPGAFRSYNISIAFRLQRILVGKTPNFTTSAAIA